MGDSETGEWNELRLEHREEAEKFYRDLASQGMKVRVGNRRASARSGHGTHWREGGNKRTYLPKET